MADSNGRRVSIGGMIAGGFLLGAGALGLFRVSVAQPLPDPALPSLPSAASALPAPALPAPSMPAVEPASGIIPPVATPSLPPLPPLPAASKPLPPPSLPGEAPAPPLVKPPVEPAPLPKPALEPLPTTAPLPPFGDPAPLPKPEAAKPPVEPAPLPKPTELAPLPPLTKPVEAPAAIAPLPTAPLPNPFDIKPVEPAPVVKPVEPAPLPPPPLPAKPDFNLRPEQPGLNVNVKDAAPAPPPELPQPRLVGNESLPAPRKIGDEIIPAPRPVIEQTTRPAPTSFAPGDAPMPIPVKQLLLSAATGMALAGTPVSLRADDPKPGDKPAEKKPLTVEDLAKELDAVKADLKLVKAKKEELELTLNGRSDGKGTTPSELGVLKRLANAEADAKAMADRVKELETKLANTKTVAEKTPLPASLAGKGTVRLVNEFRTKVSIMVNGTSYQLDANEVKTVVVKEGEFKYELIEFPNASAVTSAIAEGETVTLRIK